MTEAFDKEMEKLEKQQRELYDRRVAGEHDQYNSMHKLVQFIEDNKLLCERR